MNVKIYQYDEDTGDVEVVFEKEVERDAHHVGEVLAEQFARADGFDGQHVFYSNV